MSTDAVTALDRLVRTRRTSLLVDPDRPVDDDVIAQLIDNAVWAPNHKRTWPWSFTVLRGDARGRFGEVLATAASDIGMREGTVRKLPIKYERSAAVILVWSRRSPEDPIRDREDRFAVAAAVQNLLLSATARGLGSFWASLADPLVPAARRFAGVRGDRDLLALVYLGHPVDEVAVPERPEPDVTWLE